MNPFYGNLVLAVVTGLLGSGGTGLIMFLVQRHDQRKGLWARQTEMLLGIAHDRIVYLGGQYIERGEITSEELDDFNRYLYEPYAALGGNGTGKTIWTRVNALPIRKEK